MSVYALRAQEDRPAYGLVLDYNVNLHSADFRAFPGVPSCCPVYNSGTGSGIALGVLYQMPVMPSGRVAFRGVYNVYSGILQNEESTVVSGNVPGTFEHTVDASLASIGIEALFQYRVIQSLWLNVGSRAGLVTTSTFSQRETIVQPSNGLFPNGQPIRNEVTNAAIPNAESIEAGLLFGMNYDLPLNATSTLIVSPEVLYYLPFTEVVSGLEWRVSQVRLGASLKWSPSSTKQSPVREEKREPIVVEAQVATTLDVPRAPSLSANVVATAILKDGNESPVFNIEIEEFSSVLMTPILNYIFFDENSAELPVRYVRLDERTRDQFREQEVNNPDRLVTYYNVLNIIGARMRKYADATISLVGCNADVGPERHNLTLSRSRAEAVRQYLVSVWGIQNHRITTEVRNLPYNAANTQDNDGAEENRRVEITSNTQAITAPLITNDTLRAATPPVLRFKTSVAHDNAIAHWSLRVEQSGKILKQLDGRGDIPTVLEWNIDVEKRTHPTSVSEMTYTLSVSDSSGNAVESASSLPVTQVTIQRKKVERIADKEIQRFSLILFDVRSAEISRSNENVIDIIKPYIKPNSTVRVTGYTDRLGDALQNQSLAEQRAISTAKKLGVVTTKEQVEGRGNSTRFNPDLPEGRLYTRTVDIVIETKVAE